MVCTKYTDEKKRILNELGVKDIANSYMKTVINSSLQQELKGTDFMEKLSLSSKFIACIECENLINQLGRVREETKRLKTILVDIIQSQDDISKTRTDLHLNEDIKKERKLIEHEIFPEIRCNFCSKTFKSTKCFVIHMKKHDGSNSIQEKESDDEKYCKLCKRLFKTLRQHARHQFTVHAIEIPVKCFVCIPNITFDSEKSLVSHNNDVHSQKIQCKDCNKQFFNLSNLQRHIKKMHTKETDFIFICEVCTKMFKSNNHLKQHLKTHNEEKHYSCNLCSKSFKWDSSLNSHIQAAHNPSGPAFKCTHCTKSFKDKNNFKKHLYVHCDEKPYSCSQCGKGFIKKSLLKKHEEGCSSSSINAMKDTEIKKTYMSNKHMIIGHDTDPCFPQDVKNDTWPK